SSLVAQDASGPSGASDKTDAQILQELETMRSRIAELEAQLKQRSGGTTPADSNQNAESYVNSDAQASDQKPPEKAEPFAFADWTWLNGNPRTKTPAFDSKFF